MKTFNLSLKWSLASWPGTVSSGVQHIAIKLWLAFVAKIPVGYQDETGFHHGTQVPPRRSPPLSGSLKTAASSLPNRARKVKRPKKDYQRHASPLAMSPGTGLAGFSVPPLAVALNDTALQDIHK
jgi:hypothetical protein